jgi:predicted permease
MRTLWHDTRYAARMLGKAPGFTTIALAILAIGIGTNTAIFTLVDVLLLKPLPGVRDPGQLVLVTDSKHEHFGYPHYEQFRDGSRSFTDLLVVTDIGKRRMTVVDLRGAEAETVLTQAVSGNFFSMLGVPAAIGRTLTAQDDRPNRPQAVAVLSHSFWRRRFGLDPSVIGRTITLGDTAFSVVGVAGGGFAGVEVGRSPDLWWPIQMLPQVDKRPGVLTSKGSRWLRVLGRLKPGAAEQQACAELDVISQRMLSELATEYRLSGRERKEVLDLRIKLEAAGMGYTGLRGQFRQPLVVVMIIGSLVLLVACANLAGLLLSRGAARQREFGIRAALGAGRSALVRQLMTEGLLLAGMGGALGLLLAQWGGRVLAGYLPGYGQTVLLSLTPDLRVLMFTLVISALTRMFFGVAPAWRTSRADLVPALRDQTGNVARGRSRQALNKSLVVCQIALSCLLLIGAGLFVRTLQKLRDWDPGFHREHLLMFTIDHPQIQNFDPRRTSLHKEVLQRLEALPSVQAASLAGVQSLTGNVGHRYRPKLAEAGALPGGEDFRAYGIGVGPNYLKTMGIPLLRGRELGPEDEPAPQAAPASAASVRVMLSQSLARRLFGAEDPLGKLLHDRENPKLTLEVVGVVGDAHHQRLKAERLPMFYHLDFIWPTFYVRTLGSPRAAAGSIRQAVRTIDPQMEVTGLRTMDDVVDEQLRQERTLSQLAGFFSLSALVLACLGLYGILSYNVVRRTREIGVRMALGASAGAVLSVVIRQGMTLTLIGCAIGIALGAVLTRFIANLLYGIAPLDPLTFIGVVLALMAVALLACYLPARRAARVDPMVALRYE